MTIIHPVAWDNLKKGAEKASISLCPVCGISLDKRVLPPPLGPYDWAFLTIHDDAGCYHSECWPPEQMNYYRWARIQAYQKSLERADGNE